MIISGTFFFVLCNKTAVIKDFLKKIRFGKGTGETWIADRYLGQGVRFLPGSRWRRRGGQGLEATLKLNPSPLHR